MTYAANLQDDNIESRYLIVLKPRRKVTGFAVFAGSVYSVALDYGTVIELTEDATALTEGSSTSLSAGQWYYDFDAKVLYVRTSTSGDPSGFTIVATTELYCATIATNWYRVPTDSSTRQVHFEGVVTRPPDFTISASDVMFGVIPVRSTSLELVGLEQNFTKHFYDSSWNSAKVECYHWLGKMQTGNMAKVFAGVVDSLQYSDAAVSIKIFDQVDLLTKQWRSPSGIDDTFFNRGDQAISGYFGRPLQYVFGRIDGVPAINNYPVPYNHASAANHPNNKVWTVGSNHCKGADVNVGVINHVSNTTTRTYLNSVNGINVDDEVWFSHATLTNYYATVTAVNTVDNYIDHEAIGAAIASANYSCNRDAIGYCHIVSQGVTYKAKFSRDYATYTSGIPSGYAWCVALTTGCDANLSMPRELDQNDKVIVRLYGKQNTATIGGIAFGSDNTRYNSLTNGIVILYEILKYAGILEADIDTAAFDALDGTVTDVLGFGVPTFTSEGVPTYRQVIETLCLTLLLKIYINENNKWTVARIQPLTSTTVSMEDQDFTEQTLLYDLDYSEMASDISVEYGHFERSSDNEDVLGSQIKSNVANNTAKYLHKIEQQKTFKSYHMAETLDATTPTSTTADTLARRLSYIFGERRGLLSVTTRHPFFQTDLADIVSVAREKMPGYDFTSGTTRTRRFSVTEVRKNLREVSLKLDDQKGIEDNSGSW